MSVPAWKGLFDWSMQHQSPDGSAPKQVAPEDQQWFQEAMSQFTVDHVQRLKQIKASLDTTSDSDNAIQQKQDLLEELMDIVDNIDYARDLHTIGGLPTLLSLLQDSHACIRWRAAEVVATCVQNNPPVQQGIGIQLDVDETVCTMQWFMQGGAMPKLLQLMHDDDASCRAKALLALSCLIRLNPLALEVFRQKRGISQLVDATSDTDVKVQRKALHLLRHVIQAHPQDAATACQLGAAQQAASCLASTDDDTWQAAILLIQQLAQDTETLQQLKQDSHLQHQLQDLESRLQVLTGENRAAVEEELGHCSQLLGILHGQAAPSEPQSDTQSASSGSARQDVQRQSQPAAGSRNQTTAPLLLGPPS